jgi:hypothetical protein
MLLDSKSSRFSGINPSIISDTGGVVDATLEYMLLDVGYKLNFESGAMPGGPGVQLLGSIGYVVADHFNKTLLTNNFTTTTHFTEPIDGIRSIRLSLRPMILWDIHLPYSLILTPSYGWDIPFTKVDRDRDWKASGVFLGASLRYWVR